MHKQQKNAITVGLETMLNNPNTSPFTMEGSKVFKEVISASELYAKNFFSKNLNLLYKEKTKLCTEFNLLQSQKHIYENSNDINLYNLLEKKYKIDIAIQVYKINKIIQKPNNIDLSDSDSK